MRIRTELLACALFVACKAAPPPPAQPLAAREVQEFIREYVAAQNAGDASKLMELVSQDSGVTSINMGDIDHGWNAIRASTDSTIALSSRVRVTLGTVDVMPLDADAAIAVAQTHFSPIQAGTFREFSGAMTIVVRRTPAGLRLVHEHYSLKR